MYCSYCGRPLAAGQQSCVNCGRTVLPQIADMLASGQPQATPLPPQPPQLNMQRPPAPQPPTSPPSSQSYNAQSLPQRQSNVLVRKGLIRKPGELRALIGIAVMLLGIIGILFWLAGYFNPPSDTLLNGKDSNILGKWSRISSPGSAATPTNTSLSPSDIVLNLLQCADLDALDFLSDGTVWITSKTFGSREGSYQVKDENRLRVEVVGGSVLWTFDAYYDNARDLGDHDKHGYDDSYTGEALTIAGEGACIQTKWEFER